MEIQSLTHQQSDRSRRFYLVSKYAKFLKQPLTLEKFVPCDDEGNVLEEPDIQIGGVEKYSGKYQQAKERVLFKGFYSVDENTVSNGEIEITFGNLITLMIHRNHGSEGITKEKMFIEDLIEYGLILAQDL